MQLNRKGLRNNEEWRDKGYRLPEFDRNKIEKETKKNPFWLHFGAGNIFRAFQANVVQQLLNEGVLEKGLIAVEGYDYEIIEKVNHRHDDLGILVTLKADGGMEKTLIGSVMESLTADAANESDFGRLREIFEKSSLQIASFTITEKGYSLVNGKGEFLPEVMADFKNGPLKPASYIGKVASLLYCRYAAGEKPIAMVSMDNCSHNGTRLYEAVCTFAEQWAGNGLTEDGFSSYVGSPDKVAFPWTMIDKITPRPDESVKKILQQDGIEDIEPIVTLKKTYTAPFVNAEECEYLIIEDSFPNGRPKLEQGGLLFTDRETVEKAERMKVCTCLNPLHTALAIFGCLLGYELISEEMQDTVLKKLAADIGYKEGLPVAANPGILSPKEFLDTAFKLRIPNPFLPDTPQRIAADTSQKLAIRFGETIKAYQVSEDLQVAELKWIPLVFAGWLRYLMGIDDQGEKFILSPDPLLPLVCPYVEGIRLGEDAEIEGRMKPLLKKSNIFGVDLEEAGLAKLVCAYFKEMTAGKGAVYQTLKKYV